MISSTVSRASFGMTFSAVFDAAEHLEEDKVWCDKELVWNAKNQMSWYLKRVCLTQSSFWSPAPLM